MTAIDAPTHIQQLKREIARLTPYVEAFRREERRADDAVAGCYEAHTRMRRFEACLKNIRDSTTRAVVPWTHEAAADEFSCVLSAHREIARLALEPRPGAPAAEHAPCDGGPLTCST